MQMAARRSDEAEISLIAGSRRPRAAPIAPAIAGWPIARQSLERGEAGVSSDGPSRSPIRSRFHRSVVGARAPLLPRGPRSFVRHRDRPSTTNGLN